MTEGFCLKQRNGGGFGARLARLRKSRGLTQTQVGQALGVSKRVMAYYESDEAQPPGALLIELARALRVTTDELLGVKPARELMDPRAARLLKRLRQLELLPPADQRAVFKFIEALAGRRGKFGSRRAQDQQATPTKG